MSEKTQQLIQLRTQLERAFSPDTAVPDSKGGTPSSGHCAATAYLVQKLFDGDYVSATVQGQSHWFNRIEIDETSVDIDLTGDQFGLSALRIGGAGNSS